MCKEYIESSLMLQYKKLNYILQYGDLIIILYQLKFISKHNWFADEHNWNNLKA